jgi:hypothetical protein
MKWNSMKILRAMDVENIIKQDASFQAYSL